jgi:hypothetical protein
MAVSVRVSWRHAGHGEDCRTYKFSFGVEPEEGLFRWLTMPSQQGCRITRLRASSFVVAQARSRNLWPGTPRALQLWLSSRGETPSRRPPVAVAAVQVCRSPPQVALVDPVREGPYSAWLGYSEGPKNMC